MEYPNLPGSALCLIIGIACAAGGFAFARTLLGDAIRAFTAPLAWGLQKLLGRLEEVPARCEGWINKSDGDGGSDTYPLFSFWESGRMSRWIPPTVQNRHNFQPGNQYTLYRDRKGRYSLQPSLSDVLCMPFALIPLSFFLMMAASLVLTAAAMFGMAGWGLVYFFSHP